MRVWDVHPGYLNRQSLLGEHRELHGIVAIIDNNKKGYSRHPETLRWVGYGWALMLRHRQLACEMALRGFHDRSPVHSATNPGAWPATYLDPPADQFQRLADKYADREPGRIPLPQNTQQLWSQHKYSVLARNPGLYRDIGRQVAAGSGPFPDLARLLSELLREQPTTGGIRNAVQHMWGYVSGPPLPALPGVDAWPWPQLLLEIQHRAMTAPSPYLTASTALSDLMVWAP
jgi:hypothetical protein